MGVMRPRQIPEKGQKHRNSRHSTAFSAICKLLRVLSRNREKQRKFRAPRFDARNIPRTICPFVGREECGVGDGTVGPHKQCKLSWSGQMIGHDGVSRHATSSAISIVAMARCDYNRPPGASYGSDYRLQSGRSSESQSARTSARRPRRGSRRRKGRVVIPRHPTAATQIEREIVRRHMDCFFSPRRCQPTGKQSAQIHGATVVGEEARRSSFRCGQR
jgi:hypothetical protein